MLYVKNCTIESTISFYTNVLSVFTTTQTHLHCYVFLSDLHNSVKLEQKCTGDMSRMTL